MTKGVVKERLLIAQIERILDTENGPFQDLIIALDKGERDESAVIDAALSTINNRSLIVSAERFIASSSRECSR
jgi:hypothetical protein